jgi:hypothetical protein
MPSDLRTKKSPSAASSSSLLLSSSFICDYSYFDGKLLTEAFLSLFSGSRVILPAVYPTTNDEATSAATVITKLKN